MDFSVLFKFAAHTRQSDEEASDLTKLAQKWLAVHTCIASAPLVYSRIASDYALMELRTHNPPLHSYTRTGFDVPTFVAVLKNGLESNEPLDAAAIGPSFSQFCAALFPKPVGEEAWEPYRRRDHWKKAAYFLAAQQRHQLYALVEAIYFADKTDAEKASRVERDTAADLATLVTKYSTQHLKAIAPEELGNLISKVKMPPVVVVNTTADSIEGGYHSTIAEYDSDADHIDAAAAAEDSGVRIQFSAPFSSSTKEEGRVWDEVRRNDRIQDYRKRAGLNAIFSPQKLAKQVVLSVLGFKGTEPECAPLLAVHQTEFAAAPTGLEESDWRLLMDSLKALPGDPAQLMNVSSPALIAFYREVPKENAHDFLESMVRFHAGEDKAENVDSRFKKRYLQLHPQVDESILKTIVLLYISLYEMQKVHKAVVCVQPRHTYWEHQKETELAQKITKSVCKCICWNWVSKPEYRHFTGYTKYHKK